MTQIKAIFLVIICTFLTALGQIFWKIGIKTSYINWYLFFGCIFYGIGAVLLILAFKFGKLSTLHPFLSLGYVWVALIVYFFMNENISLNRLFGLILIILGVISIGLEK